MLYLLSIISKDLISYRDGIIYFKIKLTKIEVKKRQIKILFNILPLKKDKAVLKMPFL